MKGQTVGDATDILWPSDTDMLELHEISCQNYITSELSALDLLWPSALINEQARMSTHRDWSRPLALIGFILSGILAFVVGPTQMILVAAVLDYGWVTTTYYPSALNFVLVAAGVVALINLAALVLSWHAKPKHTYLTITLSLGSTIELALIWLSARVVNWQPHILTLVLLLVFASFIIATLFVTKQYASRTKNSPLTKVALTFLIIAAITEVTLSVLHLIDSPSANSPERIKQLSIAQEQAHLAEVTRPLSDLTYALCGEPYQIVYLSKAGNNGLFECKTSGEVFSVADLEEPSGKSLQGAAIYLGTTKDSRLSLLFPNSYYLYRSLPNPNSDDPTEDELVLMLAASTEQELVDNLTTPLLDFWRMNSDRNLFINIFYNNDLAAVTSTRDYVLMTALDTMSRTPDLPRGNRLEGYLNGKIVPYVYQADTELQALNELGADPKLYADSSRIALTTHRHISLRLAAGQELAHDSLYELLTNSFTGGL